MTSCLIDTNILVYAHDRSEPVKQKRAREVLPEARVSGVSTVSARRLMDLGKAVLAERSLDPDDLIYKCTK